MGLDSFFRIKKYIEPKFDTLPKINLCSGITAGHGNDGSFRGKVYNEFIERVTDVSLYQQEIENSVVKEMFQKLSEWDYHANDTATYGVTEQEVKDLVLLFSAAAERDDIVLIGWW